jgi:uncharacterized membrane protein
MTSECTARMVVHSGFSRNPIHFEFTTGLSGGDHTEFYYRALLRAQKAPNCVAVDMTRTIALFESVLCLVIHLPFALSFL